MTQDRQSGSEASAAPLPRVEKPPTVRCLGSADADALAARVRRLSEQAWRREDASKENRFFCFHHTRHVVFRFIPGNRDPRRFYSQPGWLVWRQWLLPVMERVTARGSGFAEPVFPKAMLARLGAGQRIDTHVDADRPRRLASARPQGPRPAADRREGGGDRRRHRRPSRCRLRLGGQQPRAARGVQRRRDRPHPLHLRSVRGRRPAHVRGDTDMRASPGPRTVTARRLQVLGTLLDPGPGRHLPRPRRVLALGPHPRGPGSPVVRGRETTRAAPGTGASATSSRCARRRGAVPAGSGATAPSTGTRPACHPAPTGRAERRGGDIRDLRHPVAPAGRGVEPRPPAGGPAGPPRRRPRDVAGRRRRSRVAGRRAAARDP